MQGNKCSIVGITARRFFPFHSTLCRGCRASVVAVADSGLVCHLMIFTMQRSGDRQALRTENLAFTVCSCCVRSHLPP
jgi:hypothetical protein